MYVLPPSLEVPNQKKVANAKRGDNDDSFGSRLDTRLYSASAKDTSFSGVGAKQIKCEISYNCTVAVIASYCTLANWAGSVYKCAETARTSASSRKRVVRSLDDAEAQ